MSPAKLWPVAIVGVLAVTIAANAVLLYEASDREGSAIESDYYRKAVRWDSTLAERNRDAALGWRLDATFASTTADGIPLSVRLVDGSGMSIDGARVVLEAIHNTHAAEPTHTIAAPLGEGRYAAQLPAWTGLWELRFDVTRGPQRFTTTLRRETSAPPGLGASPGAGHVRAAG